MKQLFFLFSILFLMNCNAPAKKAATENSEEEQTVDLLGAINRTDLQQMPFNEWFDPGYQSYQPDSAAVLKLNLEETEIVMFMGTWCSDSQREVPHLYKLLDGINYPKNKMKVIAIDEEKIKPEKEIKEWGIEYVPTIILIKNEKELGRIVETPAETLEKDFVNILGG